MANGNGNGLPGKHGETMRHLSDTEVGKLIMRAPPRPTPTPSDPFKSEESLKATREFNERMVRRKYKERWGKEMEK